MGKKKKKNRSKIDEQEFWVNNASFVYKHPILIAIFKFCLLCLGIFFIITTAISADLMLNYTPLIMDKNDLAIKFKNSTVYDSDGNYLATLSSGTKRKCISLEEMSPYLPKAYVAIEDERFYEHQGVDLKRTAAATVTYLANLGKSDFGGSTITQQVVKNITNDKEDTANRKFKEMGKAFQVEHYINKDQILELYLNIIFVGGNDINGVELGSKYYFNKSAKDLTIAECAFMAGINHAPNSYKPFDAENLEMKEKIKKRTITVLYKMQELGYIDEAQYQEAKAIVEAGLPFVKGDIQPTVQMSYITEAALDQILAQLMEEKKVNRQMAEMMLYSGGLKIYTTQKSDVQEKLNSTLRDEKYKRTNGDKVSMATMAIIEHSTGNIVATGAGFGEENVNTNIGDFNYPKSLRKQTGSCMKPISVIAPGLENNIITGATVFYDGDTYFGKYHPKNYYSGYKGAMTMREAVAISANIPHVKALQRIGVEKSLQFCKNVGINGIGTAGLSLALGGLSTGTTVVEMAGAYGAIANNGVYVQPTYYSKVLDENDNIYMQCKSVEERSTQVMSLQNAYIEKNILQSVVLGGTAPYCSIPGMDVAAKTGTTNNDNDRWLCGFTEYYSAACWYGYEKNATVYYDGNPAGLIWSDVMRKVHDGLPGKGFDQPEGIARVTICKATGKVAMMGCGATQTEVFREGNVPSPCDGHQYIKICKESGFLATDHCPSTESIAMPKVIEQEQNAPWITTGYAYGSAPRTYCPNTHTSEPVVEINQTPMVPASQVPNAEPAVPTPDVAVQAPVVEPKPEAQQQTVTQEPTVPSQSSSPMAPNIEPQVPIQ